eukprot:3304586-Pleurochrysis_carterae.AAC.1
MQRFSSPDQEIAEEFVHTVRRRSGGAPAHLQTGSEVLDTSLKLLAKLGAHLLETLRACRAGGLDATPTVTPTRDVRPAPYLVHPTSLPIAPSLFVLPGKICLRGDGGWGELLARPLARWRPHRACALRARRNGYVTCE